MVGGSSEHNPGSTLGKNVGVGRYVGDSGRGDESCGLYGTNREGLGAVTPGCRLPNVQGGGERDPASLSMTASRWKFTGRGTERGANRGQFF